MECFSFVRNATQDNIFNNNAFPQLQSGIHEDNTHILILSKFGDDPYPNQKVICTECFSYSRSFLRDATQGNIFKNNAIPQLQNAIP